MEKTDVDTDADLKLSPHSHLIVIEYKVASNSPLCRTVYDIHYSQILSIKIGSRFGVVHPGRILVTL